MTIFCKTKRAGIFSHLLGVLLLCISCLGATGVAQVTRIGQGIISTFAGMQGNNGDNGYQSPLVSSQAVVGQASSIAIDSAGNVYVADDFGQGGTVWLFYVAGDPPPLLSKLYPPPFLKGDAYALVNTVGATCYSGDTCGDGGNTPATQATVSINLGLALDATGDLYIADGGSNAIRKVDASTGYISTIAGDPTHTSPGSYSGDNGPATSAFLNYPISVAFDGNGDLYVSDSANGIIRKINPTGTISTVAGTIPNADGSGNFCVTAPCGDNGPATSAQFSYVSNIFVDKAGDIYATDNGVQAIRRIDATTHMIQTVAGTLSTTEQTCDPPACGDEGPANKASLNLPTSSYLDSLGNLYIADTGDNAVRVVDTGQIIHTVVGQLGNPGYSGDTGVAMQATLTAPYAVASDPNGNLYITDQGNNVIRMVTALPPLPQQTLSFVQEPTNVTYGDQPIDLSADVTSTDSQGKPTGLAAAFVVTSGPGTIVGSTLTPTGAGMIVVEARQAGSNKYAPATPVSATIPVNPATLTVTAPPDYPLKDGDPIPASLPYAISGYVSPDTQTGAPVLQVEGPAGPLLPGTIPAAGAYTIAVTQGSLITGANYTFASVPGKLLVSRGLPQSLTFGAYTPPTVYGANSSFVFSVTSSATLSTLYATVTASGPAQLKNLSPTTWSATLTGAGSVTLSASQSGDFNYAQATATSQFVVGPATLTVPLMNATRPYGATNPAFSYGVPTGFIGTDNSSILSGAPNYTTAATPTSGPGNYDITASAGTLYAPNYTFVFNKATLTVTQATQQITAFAAPANVVVGGSGYPLAAMASSNLPLAYSTTGPVQISSDGTTFQATGAGPATITATQVGNADYLPASATVSFNVAQGAQYISALPVSVPFGAAIPQLNWCFASIDVATNLPACDSSINIPTSLYSGAPAVTTTAVQGSVTGIYPITVSAGTLASSVYTFVFAPGTLTITPASTYTLSVNPSSITLARGQSGQATLTLTPINNYVGTVNIACSGLPAGVTCKADPAALTTALNSQGIASPVSSMLTITASQNVSQNTMGSPSRLLAAGMFGVPGLFAGILIFYRRKQFKRHSTFTGILLLVALAASTTWVSACGGGGSHSSGTQPGTTQIMITGTGTASAGTVGQSVGLTVTIQ